MTPAQLRTIAHAAHPKARFHSLYTEPWRLAKVVRKDTKKGRVRIPWGKPWLVDIECVGLVVEFRWSVG